jgi:glycosyltransferase involved in cell wall biosynthesis
LPEVALPLRGRSADRVNVNFSIGSIFSQSPDVVLLYSHQEPTNHIVAWWCSKRGIPYILSGEVSYVWDSTLTGRLSSGFLSFIVRRASFLIPSSNSCADFYSHLGGDRERMRVIPPLPDMLHLASLCTKAQERSAEIRARWGLEDKFLILFVGRFEDYKGVYEILESMDQITSQNPRVCFVFVGKGSLSSLVREKCDQHRRNSVYAGGVDDETLVEFFSVADLLAMPSWHEAYGVICAEALCCGVPVIVTKSSGCSDLVIDGLNGFLIEPGNPRAITRCVLAASSEPALARRMRQSAKSILEKYPMESLYSSLKEIILSTSSGRHGRAPTEEVAPTR